MAKKKELETMELRFGIEYDDDERATGEENQMRVVRGMADPVDLCEVSRRRRRRILIPYPYRPPQPGGPVHGGPAHAARPMQKITKDGNPRILPAPWGPWETVFSVPVRGMEALRHLVLTAMDDGEKVAVRVALLMGDQVLRRASVYSNWNQDEDVYDDHVTAQSVLDLADGMLVFLCRNGATDVA